MRRTFAILCACICATRALAQTPESETARTAVPPRRMVTVITAEHLHAPEEIPEVRLVLEGAHLNAIADALGSDAVAALVKHTLGAGAFEELRGIFTTPQGGSDALRAALSGRVILLAGDGWALAVDAGKEGNRALLQSLGAQLTAPSTYEIKSQGAIARLHNGWLVLSRHDLAGERISHALFAMLASHDASLPPEVGLRIGLRHKLPMGGATALSVSTRESRLVVNIEGQYKELPFGTAARSVKLDRAIVSRFENSACVAVAQPCDGVPDASDALLVAVLPELMPPPAMRANLSGEKLFVVGRTCHKGAPNVACCVRVDDFDQAQDDQRTYMRRIESGMLRVISGGLGLENGLGGGKDSRPPLGRFIEQQFGKAFHLGAMELCWRTVPTPCGGWQVYASNAPWLEEVSSELERAGCPEDGFTVALGAGFIHGPRAGALLRGWKPLQDQGAQAANAGIESIASLIDGLGAVQFRYALPAPGRLSAELVIEPRVEPTAVTKE